MAQKITVLYFAWVREKVGKSSETLTVPESVLSIFDLIEWLKKKDETYALAFAQGDKIKAALNQEYVSHDTLLGDAQEIAFFPPVTGG